MRTLIPLLCVIASVVAGGCTELYFYETEKFSLTVEGRPDSTSPFSGSFGLKQRVIALVPPKKRPWTPYSAVESDAMSMISYFNFDKKPGSTLNPPRFWPAVTVRTALITGKACDQLKAKDKKAVADIFNAIARTAEVSAKASSYYRAVYDILGTLSESKKVSAEVRERAAKLRADMHTRADKLLEGHDKGFYKFNWPDRGSGKPLLVELVKPDRPKPKVGFNRLFDFLGFLKDSVKVLADVGEAVEKEAEANANGEAPSTSAPSKLEHEQTGTAVPPDLASEFAADRKLSERHLAQKQMLDNLETNLSKSPEIRAAVRFIGNVFDTE